MGVCFQKSCPSKTFSFNIYLTGCIHCLPKPLLFGDNFLQFRCDICTSGSESYERENMSWIAVVHLVLYNLIRRREIANKRTESPTVDHKYFRWKDDICAFVDDYWDYLVPKRKRRLLRTKILFEQKIEIKDIRIANMAQYNRKCLVNTRKRIQVWI